MNTLHRLFKALILTGALLAARPTEAVPAAPQTTVNGDMWCGARSRARLVARPRNQALSRSSLLSSPGKPSLAASVQTDGSVELNLTGEATQSYRLEATDTLPSSSWTMLARFTLNDPRQTWVDPVPLIHPSRFYRLVAEENEDTLASDFRLLDAEGKSFELYYPTHVKAVVLIFAGDDLSSVTAQLPKIDSLNARFSGQILSWVILNRPAADHSAVTAEANALNITMPILIDEGGIVTREFHPEGLSDVVCVTMEDYMVAYRGAIANTSRGQHFLGDALDQIVASQPVAISQASSDGPRFDLQPLPPIDYAKDIAPLLREHCAVCHRPNDIAPFAMTNHAIVSDWAFSIKQEVLAARMPPWHADAQYGKFASDRSLAAADKLKLIQWVNEGAPASKGEDPLEAPLPSADKWPEALGQPDTVIAVDKQSIQAFGEEPYRYVYKDFPFTTNAWLRAVVARPSNRKVVHHYLAWPGKVNTAMLSGFGIYVPGRDPQAFPAGTGLLINGKQGFTFNLHYTPNGEESEDLPELGLYFLPSAPAKPLKTATIVTPFVLIPPGDHEWQTTASYKFDKAAVLYSFQPHMHLRGLRMKFEAKYPDGHLETLLSVPHYDFRWQTEYHLDQPKTIPAKTEIIVTGAYDNSAQNLNLSMQDPNPQLRPDATITWGEQSWDEMFIGYVTYTD